MANKFQKSVLQRLELEQQKNKQAAKKQPESKPPAAVPETDATKSKTATRADTALPMDVVAPIPVSGNGDVPAHDQQSGQPAQPERGPVNSSSAATAPAPSDNSGNQANQRPARRESSPASGLADPAGSVNIGELTVCAEKPGQVAAETEPAPSQSIPEKASGHPAQQGSNAAPVVTQPTSIPMDTTVPLSNQVSPGLAGYLQIEPARQAKNKTFYLDVDVIQAVRDAAQTAGIADSKLVNNILRTVLGLQS